MTKLKILFIDNTSKNEIAKFSPKLVEMIKKEGCDVTIIRENSDISLSGWDGIILSGSSDRLTNSSLPRSIVLLTNIIANKHPPILGVCFGMQAINLLFGGNVTKMNSKKEGIYNIISQRSILFHNIHTTRARLSHYDAITRVADDFKVVARDLSGCIQAIECKEKRIYGVQFHPEGVPQNEFILNHFILICKYYRFKKKFLLF